MLVLNCRKFAKTEKEFTDSLFNKGGAAVGYYRVNKDTISLLDVNRCKVGSIHRDKTMMSHTRLKSGKVWKSYGIPGLVGRYPSTLKRLEDIEQALNLLNN